MTGLLSTDSKRGIVEGDFAASYAELSDDKFGLKASLNWGDDVVIVTAQASVVASAFAVLDGFASRVSLTSTASDIDTSNHMAVKLGGLDENVVQVFRRDTQDSWNRSKWALLTSGTSGPPKQVGHYLSSLQKTVRPGPAERVWGTMYDPTKMAGVQVLLQAMMSGQTLVAGAVLGAIADQIYLFGSNGVSAISATPTMWRKILQVGMSKSLTLDQITLGGEIADQQILNALRNQFPDARIVHVYASTEVGAAFSVSDGLEGFPSSYLTSCPTGIELAVRDGELYVRNEESEASSDDGFVSTGDAVELVGERIYFRGRLSGVINVGGQNVWPERVEAAIREHPMVADVSVGSIKSSIAGNLLVALIVPTVGCDTTNLKSTVRNWLRDRVSTAEIPAQVKIVSDLKISATGKAVR